MNPGRFYLPRMSASMGPMMGASYLPTRGSVGLFGRIASSLRSFNWSGLLNGANKTLNVVNQTIPLVRQAGPMLNNMKSMLRLAKVFGNETTGKRNNINRNIGNTQSTNETSKAISTNEKNSNIKKEVLDDSYPNFFV